MKRRTFLERLAAAAVVPTALAHKAEVVTATEAVQEEEVKWVNISVGGAKYAIPLYNAT